MQTQLGFSTLVLLLLASTLSLLPASAQNPDETSTVTPSLCVTTLSESPVVAPTPEPTPCSPLPLLISTAAMIESDSVRLTPLLVVAPEAPAAATDTSTDDPFSCTPVGVEGDATYCIAGRVCSGEDTSLPGKECPKKGDVALSKCLSTLVTYNTESGNCVALQDAQCVVIKTGVYGCVFPSSTSLLTNTEIAAAETPTLASDDTTENSLAVAPIPVEIAAVALADIITVSGASTPGNSAEYVASDYDSGANSASVFSPNTEQQSSGVPNGAWLNAGVAVAALVVAAFGVAVVRSHRREHRAPSADSIRNLGRLEELSTPI